MIKNKSVMIVLLGLMVVGLSACGNGTTLRERMDATEGNRQKVVAALEVYFEEHDEYPAHVDQPPFVDEYIDKIPPERYKGKNKVVPSYTGAGGWMYNSEKGEFFVNCNSE